MSDLLPDLLVAVEQQLASAQTPYVAKSLARLIKSGLPKDEAMTQIAICLGEALDEMTKKRRSFDEKAYRVALDTLPMDANEETPEEPT